MSEKLVKNGIYEFNIESLCGNGNGVAKHDGFVVFVPGAAEGDILRAQIIKLTKSYAVGKIREIIKPSAKRVSDGCPLMSKCGGCSFQHISYDAETEIKKAMINDSFSHIGGLDLEISGFLAAESVCRYRNKAMYPVSKSPDGRIVAGFYATMSHRVVEHKDCLIGDELFSKIKDRCTALFEETDVIPYDETALCGNIRCIYMRKNTEGRILLTFITYEHGFSKKAEEYICKTLTQEFPQICGILININKKEGNSLLGDKWRILWGKDTLTDTLRGKTFVIPPAAFYQVNHDQTERLYRTAIDFAGIKDGDTIFDLYCGTGTIGICAAKQGVKLVGVEISPDAVRNASHNAEINGVDAEFVCLDAGEALNTAKLRAYHPDVIFVDPPRKGCGDEAVERICSFGAKTVVYISCNPQTLARDLVKFSQLGYRAEKAVGVDLFPRTGHVETVVCLSRQDIHERIKFDVNIEELMENPNR